LDKARKQHDISYSQNLDNLEARHAADQILADRAWKRVLANDSSLGEKTASWVVTNTMKAKIKLGIGLKKKRRAKLTARKLKEKLKKILQQKKPTKTIALRRIVTAAKREFTKHVDPIPEALRAARQAVQLAGGSGCIRKPRVLPIPKTGGALPALLIPLFAALGAAGSVGGGAAGIAKAVNDAKVAKQALEARERHKIMEAIAVGKGLYLKPYRKGLGLYLKPYPKKPDKVTSPSTHRLGSQTVCQASQDTPFSRRLDERCIA